jgi:sugar phosphate isomerase/epimerase
VKLGFLTVPFGDWTLEQVADFAAGNGFEVLEVACWPRESGDARRYAGVTHIDVAGLDQAGADGIRTMLAGKGIGISALGYYPNPLHPDPEHRRAVAVHLLQVIDAAALLGVDTVTTFAGNDLTRPLEENLAGFATVWEPIVAHAADRGVRIAIENCPMIFSLDEWPGGNNLAHSPAAWRAMFEAVPSELLGLNLDPSHLVWQLIDVERAIDEFAARIYHVHAKDLEIDRGGLYEHGVMSLGMGWQVPRLPGLGEVRWDRFFAALYRNGYDGPVVVEHEDRRFEGSDELVIRGFHLARDVLAPFIV